MRLGSPFWPAWGEILCEPAQSGEPRAPFCAAKEGVREQTHRQRANTIPAREGLKQKTPGWPRTMRAIPCEPAQSAEPQQQKLVLPVLTFA